MQMTNMITIVVLLMIPSTNAFVPTQQRRDLPKMMRAPTRVEAQESIGPDTQMANNNTLKYSTNSRPTTFRYIGDMPPLKYFDPLQISTNCDDKMLKYIREAELHHGRVAMSAFVGLTILDLLKQDLAINDLYNLPLVEQLPFWTSVAAYECARMGAGWKNPFTNNNAFFKLEEDYQPGNVFKLPMAQVTNEKLNKELANGRLAMLATLGYIAQELVTQQKPF